MPIRSLPRRRWIALLAGLLALWQAVLVQTHVHVPPRLPQSISGRAAALGPAAHPRSGDDPLACPLCRAMAQAGHLLTPTPPLLSLALVPAFWRVDVVRPWHCLIARSHAWYGRGPPACADIIPSHDIQGAKPPFMA